MTLKETYNTERTKWNAVASTNIQKHGITRLLPEDNFARYSSQTSTHIGVVDFLGNLEEKNILEFGCGTGSISALMAKSGGKVTAFDLSPVSVSVAKKRAEVNGLSDRVHLLVCAGENLPFASDSFDLLFGKAILHHLDAVIGQRDLHRVLKPGGRGVFIEPMGMNPILNFVRDYIPYPGKNPRGADVPLSYTEINCWGKSFKGFRFREIQLISMIKRGLRIKGQIGPLVRLDNYLLEHFPFLRKFCRYVVLYLVK